MVALLREKVAAGLVYILQEQDFNVLCGERLQVFCVGQGDDPIPIARRRRLKRGGRRGGRVHTGGKLRGQVVAGWADVSGGYSGHDEEVTGNN